MPTTDRHDGPSTQAHLPRRTLVAAGAWTIPVVAAATAAPAYAASPCEKNYSYLVDWKAAGWFARTSANSGSAAANSIAAGGQAMSIGFASAFIGAANGYTLDPAYNLSVPGPSAGGALPNVTNLGNIVPNGAERGLCLQHTASTTATVANGSPDRGQELTVSFPRDVTDLSFWLVDIDSTSTGYWDRVRFTTQPAVAPGSPSANVFGNSFGTAPFQYGNGKKPTDSNIDENTANARVQVSFAGPVRTLVMQYWNASYSSGTSIQRIYLHNLRFTAKGC